MIDCNNNDYEEQAKNVLIHENSTSTQKKHKVSSVTQSVTLEEVPSFPCALDKLNFNLKGSKDGNLPRVQPNERNDVVGAMGSTKIDMLQQNLQKLEKLERRLMRGRG